MLKIDPSQDRFIVEVEVHANGFPEAIELSKVLDNIHTKSGYDFEEFHFVERTRVVGIREVFRG